MGLVNLSVTLTVISASLSFAFDEKDRSFNTTIVEKMATTQVLDLKREGKFTHIIKPPNVGLKKQPEVVLAVLEDSKVVIIVLPYVENDPRFWDVCMNAYTPPLEKPELPFLLYLGFLSKIPAWLSSFIKAKPQLEKATELKRVTGEWKRRQNQDLVKRRKERERMEAAMKMQKKMEERKRKRELKRMRCEDSLHQASRGSQDVARL
ncbi:hypothetical protein P3S67_003091 [Capsicum chacoense]